MQMEKYRPTQVNDATVLYRATTKSESLITQVEKIIIIDHTGEESNSPPHRIKHKLRDKNKL